MKPQVLLPVLSVLAPTLVGAGEVREEILVIVNNHIITRRAFQQAVEQEHAALYRQFSGKELDEKLRIAREKTLQGLMDAYLMEDKAVDLGMASLAGEDYLRSVVDDAKKQYNFASDADFERALRGSLGIGLEEWKQRHRQQVIQQEVLRRDVYSKVAIEDQELRAYYEDHRGDYKLPSRFRIRELVLSKGTDLPAAQAKLAKIREELKAGKAFEELVKEYSSSPSRSTGGDLGWVEKGFMRKEIEEAAFSLKPGQVSEVMETDKDFYLIEAIAAEKDVVKPFQDVRQQLLEKLQEPKAQNAIEQYMQSLRVRGNVRFLVAKDLILKG